MKQSRQLILNFVFTLFRSLLRSRQIGAWLWILPVFFSAGFSVNAQPAGKIDRDTVRTGEVFYYSLSYRHPSKEEVFFPDSTFDFTPFGFRGQNVFHTRTDTSGSLDSSVYQLVSFEVSPQIKIALPVYIWNGRDCTAVYPATDSCFVALLVDRADLDSVSLVYDLQDLPLEDRVNYFSFMLAFILVATSAFFVNWLFGASIRRQWNVFRLQRRHREFTKNFNRHFLNAKNKGSIKDVEKALILWKNYLERLENKPFTTFTTREISDNISDESLSEALRETDKIIYGFSSQPGNIGNSLLTLNNVAQTLYFDKKRAIMGALS
jgi:hypothetical protein